MGAVSVDMMVHAQAEEMRKRELAVVVTMRRPSESGSPPVLAGKGGAP